MANKKESILYVLKILEKYSDKNNYLTQQQIIEYIYKDFNLELERKSIASSLKCLINLDYDIVKGDRGGFALLSRIFDDSESYYLIDAIYSSHNISKENANALLSKLIANSSIEMQNKALKLYKNTDIFRTDNKQIFLNIEILNEAIETKKKVSFCYLGCNEEGKKAPKFNGYRYKLSPYYLINNFGKYYVIGNYNTKYSPIATYRIDYIIDMKIEEEDLVPITLFKDELKNFSIDKYINDHIYLFGGNVIDCVLEIKKPESIIYVLDWFGDKADIIKKEDHFEAVIKCDEIALFYWIMQYGEEVRVKSPQSLIDKVVKNAKEIIKNHSK